MNAVETPKEATYNELESIFLALSGLSIAFFDVLVNDEMATKAIQSVYWLLRFC